MIPTRSKHPPEVDHPFTRVRKKTMVSTSGMLEDLNQVMQKNQVYIPMGVSTPPRRNNDSIDEEDDNLVFTSNKDLAPVKIKKQLDK